MRRELNRIFGLMMLMMGLAAMLVGVVVEAAPPQVVVGAVGDPVHDKLRLNQYTTQRLVAERDLQAPTGERRVSLSLAGDEVELLLKPVSLRPSGFGVWVDGPDGLKRRTDLPAPRTYQGEIVGRPNSAVAATIDDDRGTMTALINDGAGETWGVQPLRAVDNNAFGGMPADMHIVYRKADVINDGWMCGTDQMAGMLGAFPTVEGSAQQSVGTANGCAVFTAEIAFEVDFPYYQLFVDAGELDPVAASVLDIEATMNAVNIIYSQDVAINFTFASGDAADINFLIRTVEDPYTSTNAGTLLGQFRAWWLTNPDMLPAAERDITHLMTGRELDLPVIGVAYLGTICNPELGFGLSESQFTLNFTQRVALTAHELGHNWGAGHCNGVADCAIMCSSISGCTGVITQFSQTSIDTIIAFRDSRDCLGSALPVVAPSTKLIPDDGETIDQFGVAVDMEGLTAAVGAWRAEEQEMEGALTGAAYVYEYDGSEWASLAKIYASDGADNDRFGSAVSLNANRLFVGAFNDDDFGRNSGSVYVYRRIGQNWVEDQKLTPDPNDGAGGGAGGDQFGRALKMSLNTAIIGARFDDDNGGNSGSAYIFTFDGINWAQDSKLTASDGAEDDNFGFSVDVAPTPGSSLAIAGAPGHNMSSGAAYIYEFDGQNWNELFKLQPPAMSEMDEFGYSVALGTTSTGETYAVVGAREATTGNGSAYIYTRFGDIWIPQAVISGSDTVGGDQFGHAVAAEDDIIAVTAPAHMSNRGATYVFRFNPVTATWTEQLKLGDDSPDPDDYFGWSAAVNGETIIVGAFLDRDASAIQTGTASVFTSGQLITDCNGNGIPDNCELLGNPGADCNDNGIPDECEIPPLCVGMGCSADVDENGRPDDCDDCDGNQVVDSMQIENNPELDCNENAVLDLCETVPLCVQPCLTDLDSDGIVDSCLDCNENMVPDFQDILMGSSSDCNFNNIPDECDIVSGVAADCNGNGQLDVCDILIGISNDLDGNGVPDECQVDCNNNGIVDTFELEFGDCNDNDVLDECEGICPLDCMPGPCGGKVEGDVNGDQVVDVFDLVLLLGEWGDCAAPCPPNCDADLDANCTVDVFDLQEVLNNWT